MEPLDEQKSFYGIRLGCHCKSSSVGNMDQWAHAIKAFMVIALDFSLLVFQIKNLLEQYFTAAVIDFNHKRRPQMFANKQA